MSFPAVLSLKKTCLKDPPTFAPHGSGRQAAAPPLAPKVAALGRCKVEPMQSQRGDVPNAPLLGKNKGETLGGLVFVGVFGGVGTLVFVVGGVGGLVRKIKTGHFFWNFGTLVVWLLVCW